MLTEHFDHPLGALGVLAVALAAPYDDAGLLVDDEGAAAALRASLGDLAGAMEAQGDQHVEDGDERHWGEEEEHGGDKEGVGDDGVLDCAGGVLVTDDVAVLVAEVDQAHLYSLGTK